MYKGLPTFTLGNNGGEFGVVANPKSANFGVPQADNKTLAGFISLWMIPFCFNSLYALTKPKITF